MNDKIPCNRILRFALVALWGCLLTACTSSSPVPMIGTTMDVEITFDAQGCPTQVVPNTPIQISKSAGDKVKWQAVDTSGANIGTDFDIYFDPFKGKSLNSNPQGWVQSPPIDASTPINVEFKYTIVGSACPGSPLDPRIKIL